MVAVAPSPVPAALVQLLAAVPGIRTVSRGEQYRVTRRGGVLPQAAACPELRLSPDSVREQTVTLSGDVRRISSYQLALWAYEDDAALTADAWSGLRLSVAAAIREQRWALRQLPGVTDVKLTAEQPAKRALTASKQALLSSTFTITVWERA